MRVIRRLVIGIIFIILILGLYVAVDISTAGLLREGILYYTSIVTTILVTIVGWNYIDKVIEDKMKKNNVLNEYIS